MWSRLYSFRVVAPQHNHILHFSPCWLSMKQCHEESGLHWTELMNHVYLYILALHPSNETPHVQGLLIFNHTTHSNVKIQSIFKIHIQNSNTFKTLKSYQVKLSIFQTLHEPCQPMRNKQQQQQQPYLDTVWRNLWRYQSTAIWEKGLY